MEEDKNEIETYLKRTVTYILDAQIMNNTKKQNMKPITKSNIYRKYKFQR